MNALSPTNEGMETLPPLSIWRPSPPIRRDQNRTIRFIAGQVAVLYGFTLEDILAHDKRAPRCEVRHAAYAACRKAGFSYPQIGRRLNRDHTSIMNGVQRHFERAGEGA
jgi:chromosomal replication initiation ATPase DnaA